MALTSKTKLARRTTRKPNENPDPLGFAAKLEEAYQEWWRAFLRDNLIVKLKPAKLRGVVGAGTARGEPVSFPLTITVDPGDASGFARVVGKLETPVAELAAAAEPDEQSDDPDYGPPFTGLFGKRVRARRPKGGWRKPGRRR
jgi:hypothetical protein